MTMLGTEKEFCHWRKTSFVSTNKGKKNREVTGCDNLKELENEAAFS